MCRDLKRQLGSELVEVDGEPVSKGVAEQGAKLAREARAELDRKGLREVGSGELGITGTRPAGIYSALQATGLLGVTGRLPGRRAVVWGTHDLVRHATQILADAGISIERVLGADERVVSVAGESRLESVTVERDGIRETIACDLLVASPRIVAE